MAAELVGALASCAGDRKLGSWTGPTRIVALLGPFIPVASWTGTRSLSVRIMWLSVILGHGTGSMGSTIKSP